mgnify:CR=1 FL=1|tara:strand:- start:517 stop:939 length:423 start_codon:yes stop_codon:yes gene_type:complete
MNDFEFYLNEGKVKKQAPDKELAKSLVNDANERVGKVSKLDVKMFPKIAFENVYDALREILDALLTVSGYKSYSHEASIAYLKKYKIEDSVITELDNFRYKRNSSKYYGKGISEQDAVEIINFYKNHSGKLKSIINNKSG